MLLLCATIFACFVYELAAVKPVWLDVAKGFIPRPEIITNTSMLYVAIGILGEAHLINPQAWPSPLQCSLMQQPLTSSCWTSDSCHANMSIVAPATLGVSKCSSGSFQSLGIALRSSRHRCTSLVVSSASVHVRCDVINGMHMIWSCASLSAVM